MPILLSSSIEEVSQKREIKPPVFIETENLSEIGRLVCSLERAPLPLFAFRVGDRRIIAAQLDLFLGIPVFYFAYSDDVKHFLGYRTTQNGEEISLVDTPTNPSLIHAPIIEVVNTPAVFQRGLNEIGKLDKFVGQKFLSLQVKDLVSLVNVASYKMLFEESPLPIFVFPDAKKKNWCLGSFTRMEDYEEASIFFYCEMDSKPQSNFVKYSTNKTDATFSSRTDEHGYVYIKMIRLKENHPLVDL